MPTWEKELLLKIVDVQEAQLKQIELLQFRLSQLEEYIVPKSKKETK